MAKNDFLAFSTAGTANAENQATWEVDPVVSNGFTSGIAPSAKFNKAWRQAGFPGVGLSEWVNQQLLTVPIRDNGNVQEYVNNLDAALRKLVTLQSGRFRPPGNITVYVNTGIGNDNNDGLSAGSAFKTIQRGVNFVTGSIDIGQYTAYLSIAAGTYNERILVGCPILGQLGPRSFEWNTTGGTVIVNGPGFCISAQSGASMFLNGNFLFNCVFVPQFPNAAIAPIGGARVAIGGTNFQFGNSPGCYHVLSASGGDFNCGGLDLGTYTIVGGGFGHWFAAAGGGRITVEQTAVTLANSPVFTGGNFAYALDTGVIRCQGLTFPGTGATCAKYYANANGVINTGGGGASYLPGSSPGSVGPNGGQYV